MNQHSVTLGKPATRAPVFFWITVALLALLLLGGAAAAALLLVFAAENIKFHPALFRPANFIEASLHNINVALMIGHNPGFEGLLISLTDRAARLPTAALACIDLDIKEWRDVAPRCGELRWLVTPKDLKS